MARRENSRVVSWRGRKTFKYGEGREEGWKREEEESRLKILVPCLIQSPWPMSVFSRSTYRKLSLIKCLISACFSLYSLSSLVGNPGCLVRDTLFKFRHCSLPRDSSLASILRFVVNRRCFNNLRENIYIKNNGCNRSFKNYSLN